MYDSMALAARINARLPAGLARKVSEVRRRTGKSVSEIVTQSLERFCDAELKQHPPAYEIMSASGFIGCAEGPGDLSATYKERLGSSWRHKR